MKAHPEARDLAARIARHNGELIARADHAAWQVVKAVLMVTLAALGGYFAAEWATPCESAAHLCMAVVGLHSRRSVDDAATALSTLQTKVQDAVASARAAGELDGHKLGYIEGTRAGFLTGLCWGLTAGVVLMAVAFKSGWLVGYL